MKSITLALAASLAFSAAALAQTPAAPAGGGGGRIPECRDDAQKFCADKRGPERRACLTENKDKLSDACKAALTAAGG